MILSALLLSMQAAPAEPVPEIVVLANLRSIRASVGQDSEGNYHCSLDRSTGRAKLDDRLCRAVTQCVREGNRDDAAISSCIREERGQLVRQLERQIRRNAQ